VYRPSHFSVDETDVIVGLLRSAGFGHLVVNDDGGLTSTPMPFVIDDACTRMRGHVARPNPIWRSAPTSAMLIVPVTDAYVSPSWYPSKRVDGKVVPTWNYEIVHLHGRLVAHDDDAWIDRQIRDLTDTNERTLDDPWSVDDAPVEYVNRMRRGIVGVELIVERSEGKCKLSQNRSGDDRPGAIAGLRSRGDGRSDAPADAMTRE
jgi:transcriptional regulator